MSKVLEARLISIGYVYMIGRDENSKKQRIVVYTEEEFTTVDGLDAFNVEAEKMFELLLGKPALLVGLFKIVFVTAPMNPHIQLFYFADGDLNKINVGDLNDLFFSKRYYVDDVGYKDGILEVNLSFSAGMGDV